jgi:pimeloyl-ACP methyl ester carboxylesterase
MSRVAEAARPQINYRVFFSADGAPIRYGKTGTGPAVVLVHGTRASHVAWLPIATALARYFTCYLPDRRGSGASGDGPSYGIDREVEDLEGLLELVGQRLVLVGHSFGGLCALEAALHRSDVAGLFLYEPSLVPPGGTPYPGQLVAALERLLAQGEREQAALVMLTEWLHCSARYTCELQRAPDWGGVVANVSTVVREMQAANRYSWSNRRLAGLRAPSRIVVGEASNPKVARNARALAAAIPAATLQVLPGAGHLAMFSHPGELAGAIASFGAQALSVMRKELDR